MAAPVGLGAVQSELENCECASKQTEAHVDTASQSDVHWGVFSACSSSPELTRTAGSLSHIKVESISAGASFSVALTDEGRVFTWGDNEWGQLGLGAPRSVELTRTSVDTPHHVEGLEDCIDVSAGHSHVLAILKTGECYAWGCGSQGRLGLGDERARWVPALVDRLQPEVTLLSKSCHRHVQLARAGAMHSAALVRRQPLTGEAAVWCYTWGCGKSGRLGHGDERNQLRPKRVRQLATTDASTGEGEDFRLAIGTVSEASTRKSQNLCGLSLGGAHTTVINAEGSLFTFGDNSFFQLGNNKAVDSHAPIAIPNPIPGAKWFTVAAGTFHTAAVVLHDDQPANNGSVFFWGGCGSQANAWMRRPHQIRSQPSGLFLQASTCPVSSLTHDHPWPQSLKLSSGWESTLLVDDEGVLRALGTKGEPCHLSDVVVPDCFAPRKQEEHGTAEAEERRQRVCVCAVAAGCAHIVAVGRLK